MIQDSKPARPANNFGFLRLLLAVLVILSHSWAIVGGGVMEPLARLTRGQIDFGALAVDGFFVISGYLIVKSWLNKPIAREYLLKRALRVYPGYLVAYILCLFVVGALGASGAGAYFAQMHWRHALTHAALLGLPPAEHVFQGLAQPCVNGSLWTIIYEFEGYLLVLALGLAGALRRPRLCLLLFAAAYAAYGGLSLSHHHIAFPVTMLGEPNSWARFATFFLAGMCLYLFRGSVVYRPLWAWIAGGALLATLCGGWGAALTLPTCGAYLLLYAAFQPCRLVAQAGARRDLSYGLYLYAWPCQMLLTWHFRQISPCVLFALTLMPTTLLAYLSWTCIEKPAQALAHCSLSFDWKALPLAMLDSLRPRRATAPGVNA